MDIRNNNFPNINNTPPAAGQRRRFLRLGIQMKVVLVLATSLLITLTIGGWLALQTQKQDILQETNIRGKEAAHFVANALTNSVVSYDYHAIELLLEETVKNEDIVYTKVLSPKGNIMAEVNDNAPNPGKTATFSEDIRVDNEVVGKLVLGMSVERTAASIRRQTSKLAQRELITIFLIAAIEFLSIFYIIIRPITDISRAMKETKNAIGDNDISDHEPRNEHRDIPLPVTQTTDTSPTDIGKTDADMDSGRIAGPGQMPIHLRDEIGDLARTFVHLQERTTHAMSNLRKRERENRALVDAIPDMMFRLKRDGLCIACKIPKNYRADLQEKALDGKYLQDIMPKEVSDSILNYINSAIATGRVQDFFFTQEAGGDSYDYEARINVSAADEAVLILRDVTEQHLMQERIRYLANYDALTNLPNRMMFMERVSQAIQRANQQNAPIALMILDINSFKIINDTLGHSAGDLLLQEIAERLQRWLRTSDYISRQPEMDNNPDISRHGGDKFCILLSHAPSENRTGRAAQRVLEMFSAPYRIDDKEVTVSASIGIAVYPADGSDAEALLKNAEAAMYHAKSQGRGNYRFYNQSMNAAYAKRLILEGHLRKALEQRELHLYYQPQVDIRTGRVIGMESLMRWKNPELGFVSPGDFIPLAEDTGLIMPIGIWALQTACAQNKAWLSQGLPPLRIAVNLSGIQFRQPGLVTTVRQALKATGLDPKYLELELTEGVILRNDDHVIATLNELKSLGVHLSIDDFGTGYSSLSYLKRFPIDTLKIDRSFVNDITTNTDDAAIASAIIAMAHSLKLKVVAEGVETEVQLDFLQEQQCDIVQGYLFSPAVPADKFPETMNAIHKPMSQAG